MAGITDAILRQPQKIVFPSMVPPAGREDLRRIPFQGASNFRDMGGYATVDGRRTRWGVLYRSDRLGNLTVRDLLYFQQLDLYSVIDFRSDEERRESPDRLPGDNRVSILTLPIIPNGDPAAARYITERIKKGDVEGLDAIELVMGDYRRFVTRYTHRFRRYIRAILEAAGRPVLFHCTAGKDRTGFAAAITLRLIGVPEDTILNDYLLSNVYFLPAYSRQLHLLQRTHGRATADFATIFAQVRTEYLQAAYQAIDEVYRSFEIYVQEGLALSERDLTKLKGYLLE